MITQEVKGVFTLFRNGAAPEAYGIIATVPMRENVKRLREERAISKSDLARLAGLTPTQVGEIESGKNANPSMDTLVKLARAFGVRTDELIFDRVDVVHENRTAYNTPLTRPVDIPLVAEDVAAGEGALPSVAEERVTHFREDWLRALGWSERDPDRFACIRLGSSGIADSMFPTIQPGSVLLIDRKPDRKRVTPRSIWLIEDPEEGTLAVKRVTLRRSSLILESDNLDPRYAPKLIQLEGREVHAILRGRVRWYATEVA